MKINATKSKTVYFYAVNAGALAVMSPVVEAHPSDINCLWVAEGYSRQELKKNGDDTITLNVLLNKIASAQDKGGILVLGAQHDFSKTVNTLRVCKTLGVKTVFIFDHWGPYLPHFNTSNGSTIFPEHILAIDEHQKSELISIGVNEGRISVIGHPGIEHKVKLIESMGWGRRKEIRTNMDLKPEKNILLLALELIGKKFNADLEYGMVLIVMHALKAIKDKDSQLIVRLHPHQSKKKFLDFLRYYGIADKIILCPDTLKDFESIAIADIAIGLNSTFLMIPMILGIPSICVGFDPKNNPRQITIPHLAKIQVNNNTELSIAIYEKLSQGSCSRIVFSKGSIIGAWDEIRKLLEPKITV
jgi:hypothetical protein